MTLNTIEAESVSSGFRQQVQGADMERVAKTKRSTRIFSDAPIRQDDQVILLERRKLAQIHERASVLENENATLRSRIEELEQLAFVDSLTGLPNRLALEQHITCAHDHARATGETLAFAIADIDLFKLVNDRFGHATEFCERSV
jgi:PleD family two-component response regulator